MGWKSTIEISREEAIRLIKSRASDDFFRAIKNRDLELMVEDMGFGDNPDLPYFGHNFFVVNEVKELEDE